MFTEKVLNQTNLIQYNDRLVIGVSGGPDSMGLLHFLMSIKAEFNLTLIVAHINHHTRGEENTREEELIRDFCFLHDIPYIVGNFLKSGKKNFHEEARNFRYRFFLDLAKEYRANKIVLAHHEDDQVETILFKITRGNHLSGYIGMKDSYDLDNITVIRPFLNVTKDDILEYCLKNNVPYALDSSNFSVKYTRNYFRKKIIPLFKKVQPEFNQKIMQLHEQLLEVDDYLKQNGKMLIKEMIISDEKDRIILDLNKLKVNHITIIRVILLLVVNKLYSDTFDLTYEKMKNLLNIIFGQKPNITFDLGKNLYCVREYESLSFQIGIPEYDEYNIIINEFNDYYLPNGMKIRIKKVEEYAKTNNKTFILCYNSTIWPLVIRTKKDGDYIKTKIGKKKISRIFIDAKIPVNKRKTWPLLVDKEGNVLWVIGIQKPDFSSFPIGKENIMIEVLN